jgi:hypothetical protein
MHIDFVIKHGSYGVRGYCKMQTNANNTSRSSMMFLDTVGRRLLIGSVTHDFGAL